MRPISGIQPPPRPASPLHSGGRTQASDASGENLGVFGKVLTEQVRNVNTMQTDAEEKIHTWLTGGDVSPVEVLTSAQKADLAFRMLLQVRNKLIEAYREIQQIQI